MNNVKMKIKNGKLQTVSRPWSVLSVLSGGIFLLFTFFCSLFTAAAQTGPPYDLSHSVIASGGGSNSTGSSGGQTFKVEGTIGQGIAGTTSVGPNGTGGQFVVRGGFWAFEAALPTAALVSVGGRVTSANGRGIAGARVYLTDSSGVVQATATNVFGYFRFDAVEAGQTYIATVTSKRLLFAPRVFTLADELLDLDIVALT